MSADPGHTRGSRAQLSVTLSFYVITTFFSLAESLEKMTSGFYSKSFDFHREHCRHPLIRFDYVTVLINCELRPLYYAGDIFLELLKFWIAKKTLTGSGDPHFI
jgi:hypothetical protein